MLRSKLLTNLSTSILKSRFAITKEKLPSIAESIKEVTIVNYLKQEGDYIEADEEILEVETHKGNFNVRAKNSGKIMKFMVELQSDAEIGIDYVQIDTDAKKADKSLKQESSKE